MWKPHFHFGGWITTREILVMALDRVHKDDERCLTFAYILKVLTKFSDILNVSRERRGEFKISTKIFGLRN